MRIQSDPDPHLCIFYFHAECLGTELSGCEYVHPLDPGTSRPCLHGDHVVMTSGTGLVHTAPAHGQDDFR